MTARALPLALCLLWMAYQSQFNPTFFFKMVGTSLAEMQANLDALAQTDVDVAREPAWRTASTQ